MLNRISVVLTPHSTTHDNIQSKPRNPRSGCNLTFHFLLQNPEKINVFFKEFIVPFLNLGWATNALLAFFRDDIKNFGLNYIFSSC